MFDPSVRREILVISSEEEQVAEESENSDGVDDEGKDHAAGQTMGVRPLYLVTVRW